MFDVDFNSESQGDLEFSMDEIAKLSDETEISTNEVVDTGESNIETSNEKEKEDSLELNLEDILSLDSEETNDEEIKDSKNTSSATQETSDSFLLLANALAEEGILSDINPEEFNKLVEEKGSGGKALLQLMESRLESVENEIKESYGEEFKEFTKLKELGVSKEEAFNLVSINSSLEQIDDDVLEESEDVRRELLEMHFKNTTNWSQDRIGKHIEKLITSGEDIEEAKEALPEVKKFAKESIENRQKELAAAQARAIEEQQKAAKQIKESITEGAEIVTGIKLTKAQAIKAQELLLTPVELENGTVANALYGKYRAENPIEFDKKVAALIAAGAFEGKVTTTKAAETKAVDKLNKVLSSGSKASFKGNSPANNDVIDEQEQVMDSKFLNFIRK